MRTNLLQLILCPACGGELEVISAQMLDGDIWQGKLVCEECQGEFAIKDGMPHLYNDDEVWAPKKQEAEGWVKLHKDLGIYELIEDAIDLKIPYYPQQPWKGIAKKFDFALEQLCLTGSEMVLDLGAGRGWAAKQFVLHGCGAVAVDISSDNNVGLGRGFALMQNANVFFERLIADGENLPILSNSFDLVFSHATLHHSVNLPAMLANVQNVLKFGGRLCAIEPARGLMTSEDAALSSGSEKELEAGINETRPTLADYVMAVNEAGMQVEATIPLWHIGLSNAALERMAMDLGAIPALPQWRYPKRTFLRTYAFIKNRLLALLRGTLLQSRIPVPLSSRRLLEYKLAMWSTQEILLIARK